MTFSSDLDRLIRLRYGDGKKLRNIRDTIRHDNFITTEDKKYVESLISTHLKSTIIDEPQSIPKPGVESKQKLTTEALRTKIPPSGITNTKKIAIPAGIAIAVIAVIAVIGINSSNINNVEEQTTLLESVTVLTRYLATEIVSDPVAAVTLITSSTTRACDDLTSVSELAVYAPPVTSVA